ncbi:MAG: hypothetical protein A2675_01460 [Candidatus Yonathbacteria bacterium RIFCSPHIGHO2_01_FULL_51_10]|uniref:Nudix hydrolase domain-containing protein n=1 Tax=Candidatus Yonathbacteria bacterium RIFCSPHIGHO2_01_FULL_51_10 TaxID=1802723 RepID=A0A1G2S5D0_9BACT|nr:MAG: hypothetical protein A2675_01460 [Candidatus Yonathbacteria bacterium RIFCSPHIGHO2_01_FULL_51_10]
MNEEKVLFNATVCYPVRDGKVLLAFKTCKIGANCWNGYGGGIEQGETVAEAALRELREESGLVAREEHLEKIAVVDFHNTKSDGSTFIVKVHFFTVSQWTGEPKETREMITPTWFEIEDLPIDTMMLADAQFVPVALKGKKVIAEAHYGPYQKELIGDVLIQEVENLL